MFEFRDSKLGKVKVVNITEARQNMASIMNDDEFNYIITKNNKPIRAVINYQSYKEIKQQETQARAQMEVKSAQITQSEPKEHHYQAQSQSSSTVRYPNSGQPTQNYYHAPQAREIPEPNEKNIYQQQRQETTNNYAQRPELNESMPEFITEDNELRKPLNAEEEAYFEKFKKLYAGGGKASLDDLAENSTIPEPSFAPRQNQSPQQPLQTSNYSKPIPTQEDDLSSHLNYDDLFLEDDNHLEPSFEELKQMRENIQSSEIDRPHTPVRAATQYSSPSVQNTSEVAKKPSVATTTATPKEPPLVTESVKVEPKTTSTELPASNQNKSNEPPSIQDLLRELEDEKLSGE